MFDAERVQALSSLSATMGTRLLATLRSSQRFEGHLERHAVSARELGLGEDHDGILELPEDAPVGGDFH